CVDLIYIDPPFNSNRNYEVFWGEGREKRAFEDRHASTQAYIDYMRPRCVELARVRKIGSAPRRIAGLRILSPAYLTTRSVPFGPYHSQSDGRRGRNPLSLVCQAAREHGNDDHMCC
ncbi:MAG: hypothetical protein IID39_01760, partial [Planctomycetes bacterium]|nr:hypothetical protein [Planctomycetota bacterium]